MSEQFQNALRDPDLVRGFLCGLLAALVMSYVANVTEPGILHVLLALVGLAAIVGSYLFVAHSKIAPEAKGPATMAGAIVAIAGFLLLSMLY